MLYDFTTLGGSEVALKPLYAVANTTNFGGHQGVPKVSCQQAKALDVCGAQLERPQCLHTFVEVGLRLFLNLVLRVMP